MDQILGLKICHLTEKQARSTRIALVVAQSASHSRVTTSDYEWHRENKSQQNSFFIPESLIVTDDFGRFNEKLGPSTKSFNLIWPEKITQSNHKQGKF